MALLEEFLLLTSDAPVHYGGVWRRCRSVYAVRVLYRYEVYRCCRWCHKLRLKASTFSSGETVEKREASHRKLN